MRAALCLLFAAFTLPCCFSEDVPFPPGITKEKAAEGWIALYDGETTYGWKVEGDAKVEKSWLVLGGEKNCTLTSTTAWGGFELVIQFKTAGKEGGFITNVGPKLPPQSTVKLLADGWREQVLIVHEDSTTHRIQLTVLQGSAVLVRSVTLKPVGGKPIFNGKDLTGWKEIPGRKSKFSVTSNSEINVKDGNGDLQTVEEWDDFVLQVDVISNGDHLNSGVFFRCLPGEFWSGYEAQVRNEWQSTVKLKDGKTHTGSLTPKGDMVELKVGRQTMKFAKSDIESITDLRNKPIDFGSGGLYHFCPSRKVVSTDREYYTMTVIANGNHFAVWVNGYQTADHTDTRPFNKSARQGRRDDKGTISIQGHDPTTDLNFKNFRIVGLGK